MTETQPVKAAARERAVRTFLVGLATDVAVAVAVVILANIDSVDLTDRAAITALVAAVGKTIVTTVASYILRLKVKPTTEHATT